MLTRIPCSHETARSYRRPATLQAQGQGLVRCSQLCHHWRGSARGLGLAVQQCQGSSCPSQEISAIPNCIRRIRLPQTRRPGCNHIITSKKKKKRTTTLRYKGTIPRRKAYILVIYTLCKPPSQERIGCVWDVDGKSTVMEKELIMISRRKKSRFPREWRIVEEVDCCLCLSSGRLFFLFFFLF